MGSGQGRLGTVRLESPVAPHLSRYRTPWHRPCRLRLRPADRRAGGKTRRDRVRVGPVARILYRGWTGEAERAKLDRYRALRRPRLAPADVRPHAEQDWRYRQLWKELGDGQRPGAIGNRAL